MKTKQNEKNLLVPVLGCKYVFIFVAHLRYLELLDGSLLIYSGS